MFQSFRDSNLARKFLNNFDRIRTYTYTPATPATTVTSGLVLHLDAGNSSSYSGSGTTWNDLSSNNKDWYFNNAWTYNSSEGSFTINSTANYVGRSGSTYSSITNGTFVVWIKTTDTRSLFLSENLGAYEDFLGAYSSSNKYYNGGTTGSPTLWKNKVSISNLYDNIRTGSWMMLEFKGVNFSAYGSMYFNG